MGRWSFRGALSDIDLAHIARTEPTLVALHQRMTDPLNPRRLTAAQATRVVEEILGRALMRYGDHLIAAKAELIDDIVALRHSLDDAYHAAFSYNSATGTASTRATVDIRLNEINSLLTKLDAALEKLGRPMDEIDPPPGAGDALSPLRTEVGSKLPTRDVPDADRRAIDEDILKQRDSRGRRTRNPRVESGRYRFTRNADGSYTKTFEDGATAVFHIEGGKSYRVETFDAGGVSTGVIRENDVLLTPYGRLPRMTALVQANHGYQNGTMEKFFGRFGYDGNAVPTIAMRDSRRGSPHQLVTNAQNSAKPIRNATGVTLRMIRDWTIRDLRMARVPDTQIAAYLSRIDDYFVRNVLPNMVPPNCTLAERELLLGGTGWPPSGGGL